MAEECIFCRIVKGEIPCQKVAETENFMAFLDISPASEGHTLVVPKKHSTNLLTLPEYLGNELLDISQRVAQAILASTGADGFNFILNNGSSAGQEVFHTHFHIVPRKEGDSLINWHHGNRKDSEKLAEMQKKIIASLKDQS